MEVDEAANHIRELVDPDANIIWGSAFNDSLDGKIRVSVVATGIDGSGDAAVQPAPATRSFSFQPARTAAPAPVVEEPVEPAVLETPVEVAGAGDHDPTPGFSLGGASEAHAAEAAQEEPMELSDVAASYDDTADELVLSEPEAPAPSGYQPAPAGEAAPHAAPAEDGPARAVGGGTLFERMSRLSRGSTTTDRDDDKEEGVDIPRFLGRQNNQ